MTEISPFDREASEQPPPESTRVLLVASQELFRDVLRNVLADIATVQVVGESRPGERALHAAEEHTPDVVVIESQMGPDAEGLRSGYKIKAARPAVGIVVLAAGLSGDIVKYLPWRTNSGWSFISRTAALDPRRLSRAIEASAAGQGCIDPGLERSAAVTTSPLLERLTFQQYRALELLAAGASDMGIADRLKLTPAEAKSLIESIYGDMHIAEGRGINRRVVAALTYLRETVGLSE